MFSFFKTKPIWAHVKTLKIGAKFGGDEGWVFIQLFESNKGERKVDYASSFPRASHYEVERYAESSDLYQTRLVRWLSGRIDPEIPKFSDIADEDLSNTLKGSIE